MRWKMTLAAAAAVVLAGCATPSFTAPPGPPAFRVGYKDGCDSGYAWAGSPFYRRIDVPVPPRTDEPYLTGWKDGFQRCRIHMQRVERNIHSILGTP